MNEYEREIELYDYIEVLLKYKWFILVATLVCGGLGWVFRPAPPPLYEADVVLMIKRLPSQQVGDGAQAGIATAGQTSGFYQALALADDLKQALIDSLDLEMSLVAMDGVLQVQVLDPGVRLSVRSYNRNLPIPLVNAWAKLFVERNGDLNIEEVGSYYEHVEVQYEGARARLYDTEDRLRKKEREDPTGFLEIQRTMLDTAVVSTYHEVASLKDSIRRIDLTIREKNYYLSSVDDGIYRGIIEESLFESHVSGQGLKELLRRYDESYDVNALRLQLEASGLDSLRRKIVYFEKELKNHEAIHGGESNPTFVKIADELSSTRLEYDFSRALSNIAQRSTGIVLTRSSDEALAILERRELIAERGLLSQKMYFRQKQFASIRGELDSIKVQLSGKEHEQQRLLRDRELLSGTVTRFSKLLEEARITREKAAGDIRILTRALEVRTINQSPGQQKAAIAAGVGFLLSSIFSLLVEYMRKAKQRRSATDTE